MVNYIYSIRDKVGENDIVMRLITNYTPVQAIQGDFAKDIDNAILDKSAITSKSNDATAHRPKQSTEICAGSVRFTDDEDINNQSKHSLQTWALLNVSRDNTRCAMLKIGLK